MNTVTRDALGLSSGTIASLIGHTRYDVIDAVQSEFVLYCQEHEGKFETWKQAWHTFFRERILIYVEARGGYKVRISRLDLDNPSRKMLPIYNHLGVKITDSRTYDPKRDSGRTHIIRENIVGTPEYEESSKALEALEKILENEDSPEYKALHAKWEADWEAQEKAPQPDPDFPTVAGEGAPQYSFLPAEEEQLTLKL